MPSTFGIAPLIPGLVNEVALEIFFHFVAVDWDGPFTLVLVCTAWRNIVLGSRSLQSLRRNRRGGNPALKESREKAGEGICIVSFDSGGPGSLSQLRILDELMLRLAFKPGVKVDELLPADYFDMMGGVGFGGLVALLLGRLRMTASQAMDEVATIGTEIFPEGDEMVTRDVNMSRLRGAVETMLERHGHRVDIKLHDSSDNRCKVVLFAAPTLAMSHCHVFRTYLAPRQRTECTFIDAACATMAIPEYFSSVAIGPRWGKQNFAGIPHGFDNPIREVLKESQLMFGETKPVSLVLSLGSGQRAGPSLDQHGTRNSSIHCDGVVRDLQYQLHGVAQYLRLNVDNGMENIELDAWSELGSIVTHTNVYLEMNLITNYIDKACRWLGQRNGSVTLGQLTGTNSDCVFKTHSGSLENYLKMEFKQMHTVIQQLGTKWITLVDPIGNDIPIPIALCLNYKMLSDVISVYFRHQKVPGSDFVKRLDYRLVHGDRKTIVGPMEWTRVEKAGLKVEMSMVLRTRNQNSTKCPSCSTFFEGRDQDGWAQCLSCSIQFQIETQVQVESQVRSEAMIQPGEEPVIELVTPAAERTSSGEAAQLKFRLISVINVAAVSPPAEPQRLKGEAQASGRGGSPLYTYQPSLIDAGLQPQWEIDYPFPIAIDPLLLAWDRDYKVGIEELGGGESPSWGMAGTQPQADPYAMPQPYSHLEHYTDPITAARMGRSATAVPRPHRTHVDEKGIYPSHMLPSSPTPIRSERSTMAPFDTYEDPYASHYRSPIHSPPPSSNVSTTSANSAVSPLPSLPQSPTRHVHNVAHVYGYGYGRHHSLSTNVYAASTNGARLLPRRPTKRHT